MANISSDIAEDDIKSFIPDIAEILEIPSSSVNQVISDSTEPKLLSPCLEKLLDSCQENIPTERLQEVKELFLMYDDVFVLDGQTLGRTDMELHKIKLKDVEPIKQNPRRVPMHRVEYVEKELNTLLAKGIIRPSDSPWAFPVVIVSKKDEVFVWITGN